MRGEGGTVKEERVRKRREGEGERGEREGSGRVGGRERREGGSAEMRGGG